MITVHIELIHADGAIVGVTYADLPPDYRSVLEPIQQALEVPRRIKDENPVTYLKAAQAVLLKECLLGPWSIECRDLGGHLWNLGFCRTFPVGSSEEVWRPSRFEREEVL